MSKKPQTRLASPASHKTNPKAAAAFAQAMAWHQQGHLDKAMALYQKTLERDPKHTDALVNLGLISLQRAEYGKGIDWIQRSLALNPHQPDALSNLGVALSALKRHAEAVEAFSRAIALNPKDPVLLNNRGGALKDMYLQHKAIADFSEAIRLAPDYASAYNNRGLAYFNLRENDSALSDFDRAVEIDPNMAIAHRHKGLVLQELKQYNEAVGCYEKALGINPRLPFVPGYLLHCLQELCDWQYYGELTEAVNQMQLRNELAITPFDFLSLPSNPKLQQLCTRLFGSERPLAMQWTDTITERQDESRIRIGYFSPDFRNHPVTHLVAGLIEQHDRSRFEVHGFNIGPVVDDPWRQRMEQAFDHFHDVMEKSDDEVIAIARDIGLDIAVDLAGYTQFSRTFIFAKRVAPLQLQYLGYIGTMGVDFIDYTLADDIVVPDDERQYFDEKLIYLPHTYQVNDDKKIVSDRLFTREELELPEKGFIFCCHNNHYKLSPDVFRIWMSMLNKVPDSVLWLISGNEEARNNLRGEALASGIDPVRLVFAEKADHAEYMARLRVADLFLDTFYYNAGTIASEALWAGLPVLTCKGNTYVGRMAASILNAIGLPELIAHSHKEYEDIAVRLASDPEYLDSIRQRLALNKATCPLFDTKLTTRHIEQGFIQAFERHQSGLPPDHIFVQP